MDIKAAISPIRFHLNQLNLHRLAGLRFRSVDSNRAPQMAPRSSCHSARHRPTPRYSLSRCFNNSETRQNKTIKKIRPTLCRFHPAARRRARVPPPHPMTILIISLFSTFIFFSFSLSFTVVCLSSVVFYPLLHSHFHPVPPILPPGVRTKTQPTTPATTTATQDSRDSQDSWDS